jgi:ADP-ribosyl-[dinitrogen reductase] hydrolase
LPIRDVSIPGPEFEAVSPAASERLRSYLDVGENIVVHCRGGLGRAGMISPRLLVETGVDPEVAIARDRAARPSVIQTSGQEQWVGKGTCSSRVRMNAQNPKERQNQDYDD